MLSKLQNHLIKLLGGITKEDVLSEVVKDLYNTISADDILKEENGQWTFKGKVLQEQEKKLLIAEAQIFLKTRLWKVLQADIKYRSNLRMFEHSKTEVDLLAGKLWLYTLDCFKTRLESLDKQRGIFNSDTLPKS